MMKTLIDTVQHNCHISDARFAGNYTLCIYLLKMREFYRWENKIDFTTRLTNDDVGAWLTGREALWDDVEEDDFRQIELSGKRFTPFQSDEINRYLEDDQLVYSGGYASYGKPVFFLAELDKKHVHEDYTLYVCGHELARDVTAPPGMASDNAIFIRRESLRRFIWEKLEESHWHKQDNPLARALGCYNFNARLEESLEKMTDIETDTVLYHEIGEIMAGKKLGQHWDEMLLNMPRSQLEFMARAIRDHLADALSTLPRIIENHEPAQVHFYFANMTGMRKVIFPSLPEAYNSWVKHHSFTHLQEMIEQSSEHWLRLGKQLIALFQDGQESAYTEMQSLIQQSYL